MEEGRRLPLSLEESNRAKTLIVWEQISEDFSCPRLPGPPVYHLKAMHQYSVHLSDYAVRAKHGELVDDSLFDLRLQRELEDSGALNWTCCKRGRGLHALRSTGQSTGFLDAVSVCMWGVSDSGMVLRTALYNTMARSSPTELLLTSNEDQRVTREDWWKVVNLANPSPGAAQPADNPYQHVHLSVLANIIRRPIIVVGGSAEGTEAAVGLTSNPGPQGIYVPWLWEGSECHPYPVVLGSSSPWRHFVPLVTAGSAQDDEDGVALPLIWGTPQGLKDLPLHFPPDGVEGTGLSCLRAYLKLQTVSVGNHTAYAARLKGHNLPEPLSLVQDYFQLANRTHNQVTQEERESGERRGGLPAPAYPPFSSSSSTFSITGHKCATEHCLYFSSKRTWPLCHSCYGNQHQHQHQHQQHLKVRNCPPEGRAFSGSEGSICGDTPPTVQLPSDPSPASSVDAEPSDLDFSPHGGGAESAVGRAEGRCLSCKSEMRTFNGLCFRCLLSRTNLPPAPPPPDPTTETARASPEREKPAGEGLRCLTDGCVYFGTAQHAGYCTVCYCSQNQTLAVSSPPAPPPSSSSSSSSSSPLPLQLSSSLRLLPRCSGPGCDMLGSPAFQGLCERCFLTRHQGAIESQVPEARPVSQGNDQVSRRNDIPPSEPDLPSTWTTTAHAESRQSRRDSQGNTQDLPRPHRPRPCLGRGCTNFGNSRCQGLCNSCYRSHI